MLIPGQNAKSLRRDDAAKENGISRRTSVTCVLVYEGPRIGAASWRSDTQSGWRLGCNSCRRYATGVRHKGDVVKRLVGLGCDPWATRSDIVRAQDMRVAGNRDLQWSPSVAFME